MQASVLVQAYMEDQEGLAYCAEVFLVYYYRDAHWQGQCLDDQKRLSR